MVSISKRHMFAEPCSKTVSALQIDTAHLRLRTAALQPQAELTFWSRSSECYECAFVERCTLRGTDEAASLLVDTQFATIVSVRNETAGEVCRFSRAFGEFGEYEFVVENSAGVLNCTVGELRAPVNSFLPLLYAFFALVAVGVASKLLQLSWKRWSQPTDDSSDPIISNDSAVVKKPRLQCLDVFRGICILIMIFVNYGGGQYWFFQHSAWNGLTVADLVFPWFMFIMGTAMAFTFESSLKRNLFRLKMFSRLLRRSLTLIALGLILNSSGDTNVYNLRLPGVLQKFGIAYFVIGSIHCAVVESAETVRSKSRMPWLGCLIAYRMEWTVVIVLVVIQLLLTFLLPVPGCPTGYLGAGGLADYGSYANCTGGAAQYVDRIVFGTAHIYQKPTCSRLFQTTTAFDPEGLLGNTGSIFITFLGLQAGQVMQLYETTKERMVTLFSLSFVTGIPAGILCRFAQNEGWIPVNKNLWSLSFVLALSSMAFVLLCILYWIVDVKRFWRGSPFYQAGLNSILLYILHETFKEYIPVTFGPVDANSHLELLFLNMWQTFVWTALSLYLHHKKFYYSV